MDKNTAAEENFWQWDRLEPLFADLRGLFVGSGIGIAFKVGGGLAAIGLNLVLGRILGPEETGRFYQGLSLLMFAATAAGVGLDREVVRSVAAGTVSGTGQDIRTVYTSSTITVAVLGIVGAVVLWLSAGLVSRSFFQTKSLSTTIRVIAIAVVPFVLVKIHSQALRGANRIAWSQALGAVSLNTITAAAVLLGFASSADGAALAYAIGSSVVLIAGYYLWSAVNDEGPWTEVDLTQLKNLVGRSRPYYVVDMANYIMSWSTIALLGVWEASDSVGIFSVSTKIANGLKLVIAGVNIALAPKIASLFEQGKKAWVEVTGRTAAAGSSIIAVPVVLVFLLAPGWVLSLFGAGFEGGSLTLRILTVGHFVNILLGSVGYMLMMTGHQKIMRNIQLASAGVLLLLYVILTPVWGRAGAAAAATLSLVFQNIYATLKVRSVLDIKLYRWCLPSTWHPPSR